MKWAREALDSLDAAGYRRGGARETVVELLARQNCCLSAQEIHDRLRKARRPVGIASVYRALETLADGAVDAIRSDAVETTYRRCGSDRHHYHLVCRDCGKVEAFSDSRLERAIDRVADGLGYSVEEHEVVLAGVCADCG